MPGFLTLEHQVPFYGAYHSNKTNVSIHMVFVPTILYTVLLFLSNTGPLLGSSSLWPSWAPESNAASLLAVFGVPGYIYMQPTAGLLTIPIFWAMVASATSLTKAYGSKANYYGLGVHVVSWIMQFVGHGVYEGRKPALLDNIFQALYLAPFFVFLEMLFSLGWNKPLEEKLEKLTAVRRREVQAKSLKNKKN